MQRIIPPRNKQHIIRRDRRATGVFRETLEVLGHAFWGGVVSTIRPLPVMGVQCSLPICAHTISVSAPMNWGVAFTPRRRVSASTILPMENQRAALRRCGCISTPAAQCEDDGTYLARLVIHIVGHCGSRCWLGEMSIWSSSRYFQRL
jgi:hypothetical protein